MKTKTLTYWLLTTEYPPFFGGGIGTYCALTAQMFAERGHHITVFVNDASITGSTIETTDEIRVIRFGTSFENADEFLGHVTNISYAFAKVVKQFVEKEGSPHFIEAQEYLGIGYYLLQFKKLLYNWCRDIPVVITAHSPSFLYLEHNHVSLFRYPNYWIGEMERYSLQAADAVISPSQYLLKEIEKQFEIHNQNVSLVVNPFRSGNPLKPAPTLHEVVFFGKLSAQKGTFRLLTDLARLWDNGFNKPVTLIGGQDIIYHPESRTMGDVVRRRWKRFVDSGLLKLEGPVAPQRISERMSRVKFVIVPSTVDNLPYVVLEMMSLGKIVLVSRQGGQAEIVQDGINGFVFDHDEPGSFGIKLNECLNLNDHEVTRISSNAIDRINEVYSFQNVYAAKMSALDRVGATVKDDSLMPLIRPAGSVQKTGTQQGTLLSVVIPYFNMGVFIEETVQSVLASGYDDQEIIIVNDGSRDTFSLTQLDKYRNREGFVVIDTQNEGLGSARNTGARQAKGRFLAFLDSDDLVAHGYYLKAVEILTHYKNIFFAGCWTQYFGDSDNVWPTFTPEPPLILYHNTVNSSSLVYERAAFLAAGLNDRHMPFQGMEDYESVVRLLANGYHGIVIPEKLFRYRVRHDSMIRSVNPGKKLVLTDYICRKHAAFYSKFAVELAGLLNANGPGIYLDNPTLDLNLEDKVPFKGELTRRIISVIKKNRRVKMFAYKVYRLLNK